jgi:hypothetical protein
MYGRHLRMRNLRIPRNAAGDSGVMSATFTLARPETMRSSTSAIYVSGWISCSLADYAARGTMPSDSGRNRRVPAFAGIRQTFGPIPFGAWFGRLQRLQEGERT